MQENEVADNKLPEYLYLGGCKWAYKTKRNSKGTTERFKARIVARFDTASKNLLKETFPLVSSKDSFKITTEIVGHFN